MFQRCLETLGNFSTGKNAVNFDRLGELFGELQQCREGMRRQEVKQADEMGIKILREKAKDLLDLGEIDLKQEGISSKHVHTVIQALETMKTMPGVHEMISKLHAWQQANQQHMAWNDFVGFSEECSRKDCGDLQALTELMQRCNKLPLEKEDVLVKFHITNVLACNLRALIKEASCFSFQFISLLLYSFGLLSHVP